MQALRLVIPVGEAYTAGDYADVYLNDARQNRAPIPFFPGTEVQPGYGGQTYGVTPYGDGSPRGGYGDGVYGLGEYGGETFAVSVATAPLYHGVKEFRVEVCDYLGNGSPGDPAEQTVYLHTGPTAPKHLRFSSQAGAGPVTFSFSPSVEFAA